MRASLRLSSISPRPSSTKTRIKTSHLLIYIFSCAPRDHPPLKQGLRHPTILNLMPFFVSPRPSSTKTRIKTYNSLDFCYEIVISETILKKIAGSQEFGSVYQTFSSRQHILLSVCRLMSVQSAQVFVSEYAQKHPNVSSEFSRDYRTSYEFFMPPRGIKKGDYIQRIKRCAVIPFTQCDPGGARTLDPLIKSQLLYQLSYGVIHRTGISLPSLRMQRYNLSANRPNIFFKKFFSTNFFARTAKRCRQIAGTADNMYHPFICP